jgi:hypothetical protein
MNSSIKPVRIIDQNMFNLKIDKQYKVYLLNSNFLNSNKDFFDDFMIKYSEKANKSDKKFYICIDCEFNTKKIALIQINFEEDNDGNIFLLDPKILSNKTIDILKNKILCNSHISKIFHGADSLDIPYFFYDFFNSDTILITKFMENFVDTRFLCEFYNTYNKLYHNIDNHLCNIYYLYEKYSIINSLQRKYLDDNEEKMGKLYDIFIEIDTMTDELINYTMYDVVYLKFLYKRMKSEIVEYKYINEMVQLVYLDKRNIVKFVNKEEIEKFNINYFFKDNKLIRLSETIETNSIFKNKIFNTLYNVNYFKMNLNLILKNIIYSNILDNDKVFENKTTIQNNKLSFNELFNKLKKHKINNLLTLLDNLK